jgi:hypothetical protein
MVVFGLVSSVFDVITFAVTLLYVCATEFAKRAFYHRV